MPTIYSEGYSAIWEMWAYNNFRGHESLRNKTPTYRAKIEPPFKEWADVVKAEAAPRHKTVRVRPASMQKSKSPRLQADKVKRPKAGKV